MIKQIINLSAITSLVIALICTEKIFFMIGNVGYLVDIQTTTIGIALILLCIDFVLSGAR